MTPLLRTRHAAVAGAVTACLAVAAVPSAAIAHTDAVGKAVSPNIAAEAGHPAPTHITPLDEVPLQEAVQDIYARGGVDDVIGETLWHRKSRTLSVFMIDPSKTQGAARTVEDLKAASVKHKIKIEYQVVPYSRNQLNRAIDHLNENRSEWLGERRGWLGMYPKGRSGQIGIVVDERYTADWKDLQKDPASNITFVLEYIIPAKNSGPQPGVQFHSPK